VGGVNLLFPRYYTHLDPTHLIVCAHLSDQRLLSKWWLTNYCVITYYYFEKCHTYNVYSCVRTARLAFYYSAWYYYLFILILFTATHWITQPLPKWPANYSIIPIDTDCIRASRYVFSVLRMTMSLLVGRWNDGLILPLLFWLLLCVTRYWWWCVSVWYSVRWPRYWSTWRYYDLLYDCLAMTVWPSDIVILLMTCLYSREIVITIYCVDAW